MVGLGTLLLLAISVANPTPFITFGQRVVDGSDLAQMAFADGRMFWSYQSANLLHFGLIALLGGLLLWWLARKRPDTLSPPHLVTLSLLALLFLDLWLAHGRFNPASDVSLSPLAEGGVPPVVRFINEREGDGEENCQLSMVNCQSSIEEPWRFTTFDMPGEKTFNANVGMYYGWQDIRGYDSIIPRQYADFMQRVAPQENELLYNRIAPLYSNVTGDPYAILNNPLLNLLNVKYVLTEHALPNPQWQEVYRDEAIGVYENQDVMPRVFLVPEARVVPADEQPLTETDLRDVVFVEEAPVDANALVRASPEVAEARVSRYTANDVFVDVNLSDRGWLVLTDAYFPGWKAFIRPFGADESQEQELTIQRADSAFRTVYLPDDGQWTVRFVYSPMSFKLGIYVTFLAMMVLAFLMLYWLWGRFYRPESTEGDVRTVAKNSVVPLTLNLANKAIDFAFAMLYVRILGPEGTGKYYFVVALYGFFEIISRYGLGTLLTRDVAADKNLSSRYLTNVLALRTLLWLITMPVLALVTWFYANIGTRGVFDVESIGKQEVQAIAILGVAMLFANWADALSSSFHAFEKMEYPAALSSASAILKVTLGATVLLLGWSFVGLAAVALLVNIIQVIWLYGLLRVTLFKPQWHWDWPLQRWMFTNSGPLMINHLLATIFWRIDVWILRPLSGAAAVGLYSVGLKYLDGLNIIPSVFTMAIFPLMSRYATRDDDNLLRSYVISIRLLVIVSLPIAMSVTFLAEPLVWLVGGAQYINVPETVTLFGREITFLGGSDLALQVIIWSIPIGFVNSVTQFVLIAVNQQHFLTRAFIIGVVFNTVGNLLLIPYFGYIGAAVVTILSEFSLLFPFYYSVKRNVGTVPWLRVFTPPAVSVAVMGLVIFLLSRYGLNVWLAVALSWIVYAGALVITRAFRGEEMAMLRQQLPLGPLRRLMVRGA
jgi:O-antigen/teichoic acid export membrane protein